MPEGDGNPTASAGVAAGKRWLFGPLPDLVLGCGLGYVAVFAVLVAAGSRFEQLVPFALFPILNIFSGAPHYGATLLRVYERRESRRAYAIFSVHASIAVFLAFLLGLYDANVGSWLLTLYLSWSPWHYAGQNYGVALMFLHRRGIPVTPLLKRLIYASFLLSFALTFFALHGKAPAASYAPVGLAGLVYQFRPLGIPADIVSLAMGSIAVAYAGVLVALFTMLLRRASPGDLLPTSILIGVQALWFSAPALAREWGLFGDVMPFSIQHAAYAFIWIAVGHSIQYLWITAYYAAREGRSNSHLLFFTKAVLAGMAIWTVPTMLFAPGVLGRLPYDAGLGALVAAMVNIHHFMLDGAIWKLRDGRVAGILLRMKETSAPLVVRPRLGVGWPLVAFAGALALIVTVMSLREDEELRGALEKGDLARAEQAVKRLDWLGRDSPEYRYSLGSARAREGDSEAARAHLAIGLELHPTAHAWMLLGRLYEADAEWREAAHAYESAAALRPEAPIAYFRAGIAYAELREGASALEAFSAAVALAPDNAAYRSALEKVEEALERKTRRAARSSIPAGQAPDTPPDAAR